MKSLKYITLSLLALGMLSCENELVDDLRDRNSEDPVVFEEFTQGSLDVSKYVALGNSLTAGFSDGALYRVSQENSTPAILAQQFEILANGGPFSQPLTNDNVGGLLLGGTPIAAPRLYFYIDQDSDEDSCPYPNPDRSGPSTLGTSPEDPSSNPALPTTDITMNPSGPFNNLGVPGAKSFHLLAPGYGNTSGVLAGTANPYFVRMASSPSTTVIADAIAQQPSFVSLWIGNNDVLGYALSGGDGTNPITPLVGPPGVGFEQTYQTLVASLTGNIPGVQGILGNIPNVTAIPHFTTVPYNPLDPCNPDFAPQIPTLNTFYSALNGVYDFLGVSGRSISFSDSEANPVVIVDETLPNLSAQITQVLNGNPQFPAFLAQFGIPSQAAPQVAALIGQVYGQARPASEEDLLVLPLASVIGTVNQGFAGFLESQGLSAPVAAQFSTEGVLLPLEDKWVLLPSEQTEIADATAQYNQVIETAASANGFALLDANTLLDQLATTGIASSGLILTSNLVTGGAFSLDGVHPNSRGYALIANEMLKAIDDTYGTNFEASGNLVDVSTYNTNYSPLLQ